MEFFTMCVLAAGIGMALGTLGTGLGNVQRCEQLTKELQEKIRMNHTASLLYGSTYSAC